MPYDYAGCLHIHTTSSDGSGHFIDVVEAAREADLDWILLSDHETMRWRQRGGEGWYGSTFVFVGQEMGRAEGHYLGVGLRDNIPSRNGASKRLLKLMERQGAGAIVLHPDGPSKPSFGIREHRWKARRLRNVIGLEVWSYMYDWLRELNWLTFPYYYFRYGRAITGPSREALALWDRLGAQQPITGIGGLDVHRKQPWPFNLKPVFDYAPLFRSLRTHLLTETPWSGDIRHDRALIQDALTRGRCFFANDALAPSRGFRFRFEAGNDRHEMGEEVVADSGAFRIHTPANGRIRLVRDGAAIAESDGDTLTADAHDPGVYRAEVSLNGRPWIFSNPIYLRETLPL